MNENNRVQENEIHVPAIYRHQEVFPVKNFPLTVMRVRHPGSLPEHQHDFVEIMFIFRGNGRHHARSNDGKSNSFNITAGDVFTVWPGVSHSFSDCNDLWLYNLLFTPELLAAEVEQLAGLPILNQLLFAPGLPSPPVHLSGNGLHHAVEQLNRIINELASQKPGFELGAKTALLNLLLLLGRLPAKSANDGINPDHHRAVHRAITYMEKHFSERLTLALLTREAHLSQSCFCRSFKTITAMSPWDYLTRIRLENVKTMLLSTDLPIQEIAAQTGLCDSSYLTKIFKRHEQLTPHKFRDQWSGYGRQ